MEDESVERVRSWSDQPLRLDGGQAERCVARRVARLQDVRTSKLCGIATAGEPDSKDPAARARPPQRYAYGSDVTSVDEGWSASWCTASSTWSARIGGSTMLSMSCSRLTIMCIA